MKTRRYLLAFFVPFLLLCSLVLFFGNKTSEKNTSPIQLKSKSQSVRKAAVAGSFYPADKKQLEQELSNYVTGAKSLASNGKLRILIVPHAGITYSGQVAGSGFKQLEGENYSKVIILGSSHKSAFPYVSVYPSGRWETPLGFVAIDEILADNLVDQIKGIRADASVHGEEHSLELELIFLQKVLKDFEIVPILIGQVDDQVLEALVEKISLNFDENTLLVISTDLSHYPDWETAKEIDDQTITAILSGNSNQLNSTISAIEAKGYPNVATAACGHKAIWVALEVAKSLGLDGFAEISRANSGDVTQDKSRVVGYGAIGVWGEQLKSVTVSLDEKAQEEALAIAENTLKSYVTEGKRPEINTENEILNKPLGAFVTLEKSGQLRGCIGSFEPTEPLSTVIQNMTILAASKDQRFQPVTADELKDIIIEISVMTPKKRISDWRDIVLGKHGVVIQKGASSGTFLPQVATDTGWSLDNFLSELCAQKAGLPRDCYKDPTVNIYTFEAQVFGL